MELLSVSMAGIKLGDRLLIVGCADPLLIARLAVKTGLTGRACAADAREAVAARAADVTVAEGALVETIVAPWTTLPLESDAFDVAIVRDVLGGLSPDLRAGCVDELRRVLRPGGRCLMIDSTPHRGLGALVHRPAVNAEYIEQHGAVRALESGGFRAVRTLAERAGLMFVEGLKVNL